MPGAMLRNRSLKFICKFVELKVETSTTPFTKKTKKGETLNLPIAHGEGNYFADEATLFELKQNDQIVLRYRDNPNGSAEDIAGICNFKRNVFGLMPHPERASEKELGSTDGLKIFQSIVESLN